MEFEQSFTSVGDWGFPSPTATPTTATFGSNTIQTPKTATFPSHFQDAFATPQLPSYGTPQQPAYSSSTPMQRPQSSSETLRSNYYAAVQAQGGSQNMNTSAQYTPDLSNNGAWNGSMIQPSPQGMVPAHCDPTQMQTPPPTRGTSVKKPQLVQNVAFGTPSTIASRRFMTPQQHVLHSNAPMQQQQTPMQFPMLQLSPDMQQVSNMGPMTAPVPSQVHNFWEPQPSPLGQPIMLDDPFGLNTTQQQLPWTPDSSISQHQHAGPQVMPFDTPAMNGFAVQQPLSRPASAAPATKTRRPSAQPPMSQTSASVDPSLVYSSPAQPMLRRTNSQMLRNRPTMEQVDSKRRDSAATTLSSTATPNSRPTHTLRRCNTTGDTVTTRPRSSASSNASSDSLNMSNIAGQSVRSGSPLKRVAKTPLDSISEAMRPRVQKPSVVLTIDENGRARAVPQVSSSTSPTKSVRERYPGLFDSDSSDEESSSSCEPPSRKASLSIPKGEDRRPKVARLDTPVENLEGLSLPRSASSASLRVNASRAAIAAAAQLKRHGSIRKPSTVRSRKPLQKSASYSSMIDTCPMDFGNQATNTMGSASSLSPADSQSFTFNPTPANFNIEPQNEIDWSLYTMDQPQSQQMAFQTQPQLQPPHQYQHQTPQHQQHDQQQQSVRIRCPCGDSSYHGDALVKCNSCTQYQHPACVNINPMFGQPPSYCCFLCQRPQHSNVPMRRTTHG
ncbi:hypothetical protein Q7P37_010778 [Cladosporium fusiforme]